MRNALRTSVGCLFIALLLNASFTLAQTMWLCPYPPKLAQSDMAWMQIASENDSHKPENTVIRTTAIPFVKRIAPNVWMITFKTTIKP